MADESGPWARHLVVLTSPYPAEVIGRRGDRWYLCPSEPPAADRWDHTRPERIDQTIALGRRDAGCLDDQFSAWLAGQLAGIDRGETDQVGQSGPPSNSGLR